MLICNKIKKAVILAALAVVMVPSAASACNPINPICLFKKMLKACPGLPVFDFVSVPAIIPHVPAALSREAQNKAKEFADKKLEQIRSVGKPADVKMPKTISVKGAELPNGKEIASLEAFPKVDGEDPLKIAQAVEVLFLRPGWQDGGESGFSSYDMELMAYYRKQFQLNNIVEAVGFYTVLDSKIEELMASAEKIQSQLESADDLNKSERVNYEANLLEYQLQIVYNQLLALKVQLVAVADLVGLQPILTEPLLGKM